MIMWWRLSCTLEKIQEQKEEKKMHISSSPTWVTCITLPSLLLTAQVLFNFSRGPIARIVELLLLCLFYHPTFTIADSN
jgi:hypothetical protein